MNIKLTARIVLIMTCTVLLSLLIGCSSKNNSAATVSPKTSTATPSSKTSPTPKKPVFKNLKAKALYLSGWTVGSDKNIKRYVDIANNTEINSYVVDIKDDDGYVGYKSSIPEVVNNKAFTVKYDVDKVIQNFHENNIYVIGRIVCFKDPIFSSKHPEYAIKTPSGASWKDNHGKTWLNPYSKEAWNYLISIAKEGLEKGFDEIQFDYVRFANDGRKRDMNFGNVSLKKYEIIDEFLAYAKKGLPNTTISADVFGIICESPADFEDIGQNLEYVGQNVDYICPMVYPSHYASGQTINGVRFSKPDLDPYGVVYNTLVKAKKRISAVQNYKAKVRPYLQSFSAKWLGKGNYQIYGDVQVRQQIKAVYDAGYDEWIMWDAANKYSESAYNKK